MGEKLFYGQNKDWIRLPYVLLQILESRYPDQLREEEHGVFFKECDIRYLEGIYDALQSEIFVIDVLDHKYILEKVKELINKIKEEGSIRIWIS